MEFRVGLKLGLVKEKTPFQKSEKEGFDKLILSWMIRSGNPTTQMRSPDVSGLLYIFALDMFEQQQ